MKQYTFHADASHGWLAVSLNELIELDVKPSSYSYFDKANEIVYLEEDQDAGLFIKAYINKYKRQPKINEEYQEQSFVRSLRTMWKPLQ